jgi:hypothetical protein
MSVRAAKAKRRTMACISRKLRPKEYTKELSRRGKKGGAKT